MSFLRNAWYVAAWGNEVSREPLGRMLLSEEVVLFRKEDGNIVALGDVCPHRFAPLHKGQVRGDSIECPYHGLRFSSGGGCSLNPHGDLIPPELHVKSYVIAERHALVWIWMGGPARADEATIPDFGAHTDPDFVTVGGRISIAGSYQLVADNLLDLSHTQYLHPILVVPVDDEMETVNDIRQDGDMLNTTFDQLNIRATGFINFVWPDAPERLDSLVGIRWQAPANMLLKVHFATRSPEPPKTLKMWGAELITPETETSCHYFWSTSRNFRIHDKEFGDTLATTIESVFTNEDGVMIADVQKNMGEVTDLISLRPVILPTDSAAVRARMLLRKMIRAEGAEVFDVETPREVELGEDLMTIDVGATLRA